MTNKPQLGFKNKFYKSIVDYIEGLIITEKQDDQDQSLSAEDAIKLLTDCAYDEKIVHFKKLGYSFQAGLSSWLSGVAMDELPFQDYEIIKIVDTFNLNDHADYILEYWFDLVAMVIIRRAKELNVTLKGYDYD